MIKKLVVKNLYGRNYDLNFNEDLTIFHGRNGSGKTTILNIIQLIFDGEFKKVCGYNFDNLNMKFIINNIERELEIFRNEDDYTIQFNNLEFKLKKLKSNIDAVYRYNYLGENIEESSNFMNLYSNHLKNIKLLSTSDEDELRGSNMYQYLKRSLEYVYIPLNRRVKASNSPNNPYKRSLVSNSNKKNIEDSLNIAESYFAGFRSYINRRENIINDNIKTRFFNQLSSPTVFKDMGDFLNLNNIGFKGLEKALDGVFDSKIERNIRDLLDIFYDTEDSYKIKEGRIVVNNYNKFITHTFSMAQLNKLQNVIKETERKNIMINKLKNTFTEVLENINLLFEETGKKIGFDEINQKLYFSNTNSSQKLEMALLSSGEKQLVIFFIFSLIDYKNRKESVLLIDEPELSLHIEWQERLLPSIMKNGGKRQIVIATHSPDIIGDYVDKCIEIKGV